MSNRFQEAKRRITSAPETYFPGGKWENGDYFFSRRADDKTPSTHIVPDSEQVKDFGDPDYRGSVLDCYAEMMGITAAEAVDKILGPDFSRDTAGPKKPAGKPAKKKPVPTTPIPPEAAEALAKRAKQSHRGRPVRAWKYRDEKNGWLFSVIRFEDEAGKKSIIPYYMDSGGTWREGLPFSPRPLYNLPEIIAAPDTPVLLVEGEKCASINVPGFVTTTWSGGTSAVHRTDWEPLKGRKVLIWPDADEVGRKAADQIQIIIGGETEIMEILEPRPQGWDIADAADAGMDLAAYIKKTPRIKALKKPEGIPGRWDDFFHLPTHGAASDIIAAHYGDAVIFETTGFNRGEFWQKEEGRPFFVPLRDARKAAGRILAMVVETTHKYLIDTDGTSPDLFKDHKRALKAIESNDFLASSLRLYQEMVTVPTLEWNSVPEVLCLEDAILDFSGKEPIARDAAPGEYFREPLPVSAEDVLHAGRAETWETFVENLFPADKDTRKTFYHILSLAVAGRTTRVFSVFFNKFGSNGKNLTADVLTAVLGRGVVTMLPGDIVLKNGDSGVRRFGPAELEGVRLAFFDEVSGAFDVAAVKSLTGGSPIRAEKKGRDPKMVPATWNIAALTNRLPNFWPADDLAFLTRLLIVPFSTVFVATDEDWQARIDQGVPEAVLRPGANRQFVLDEIEKERPAVLRCLVDYYMDMRDNHGGRPYESQACKDEKKAYRDENDKITEFMQECGLVADREGLGRIEIARIMQLWKEWDPEDKKMTTRRLSKNLREKYELTQSKAINGVRYLTGIYEKTSELDFAGQGEGA